VKTSGAPQHHSGPLTNRCRANGYGAATALRETTAPLAHRAASVIRVLGPPGTSGWGLKQITRPLPKVERMMAWVPVIAPEGAPFSATSVSNVASTS